MRREPYREWRERVTGVVGFWAIVDANWTPAEQNELAREWKQGRYVTENDGA